MVDAPIARHIPKKHPQAASSALPHAPRWTSWPNGGPLQKNGKRTVRGFQAADAIVGSRSTCRSQRDMNASTSGVGSLLPMPCTWTTFLPRTSTV